MTNPGPHLGGPGVDYAAMQAKGEHGDHDADQRPVADYRSLRAMWGWQRWQPFLLLFIYKYTNEMIIYNCATTGRLDARFRWGQATDPTI